MKVGADLVLETVQLIEKGNVKTTNQEEILKGRAPKLAYKIFKSDCLIDWNQSAQTIFNLIRGLSPYPAAFFELKTATGKNSSVKVFTSSISQQKISPGTLLVENNRLFIGTNDMAIELLDIQLSGKKRMFVKDCLNGFDFGSCTILKMTNDK